jgi:hypothetical protein
MTTDPLAAPPGSVLSFLSDRMRRDEAGNPYFLDDAGLPILDVSRDGCPPADAKAVAAWTRTNRRDLWAEKPTETAAATAHTAADVMAQVRTGALSASEATARLLGAQPAAAASPQPGGPINFTEAMARARAGDASALAALKSMVHTA